MMKHNKSLIIKSYQLFQILQEKRKNTHAAVNENKETGKS